MILDNLYDRGKIKPMVVVMGDRNVDGALGAPQDDKFVPEVLDNLVPAVQQAYRVRRGGREQALAGLSLGGLNTFNTVLTRPGAFREVGDFSSGYFPTVVDQIKTSGLLAADRVRQINKQTDLFRVYIGNKTDIAYANNVATRALFDKYGVDYDFAGVYQPAGHVWKTWQHNLADFAPRVLR